MTLSQPSIGINADRRAARSAAFFLSYFERALRGTAQRSESAPAASEPAATSGASEGEAEQAPAALAQPPAGTAGASTGAAQGAAPVSERR